MSNTGGAAGAGTASHDLEVSTVKEIEKDSDLSRSASDPSIRAEKGEYVDIANREKDTEDEDEPFLSHEEQFPIDPNAEEELQQFTFRAVFVGCILGGVIAASK